MKHINIEETGGVDGTATIRPVTGDNSNALAAACVSCDRRTNEQMDRQTDGCRHRI